MEPLPRSSFPNEMAVSDACLTNAPFIWFHRTANKIRAMWENVHLNSRFSAVVGDGQRTRGPPPGGAWRRDPIGNNTCRPQRPTLFPEYDVSLRADSTAAEPDRPSCPFRSQ